MLTAFTPANTAFSWLRVWVMLMGWHKRERSCSLGSVNCTVQDALQRGNGKWATATLTIKQVLKCVVEPVPKAPG